MNDEHDNAIADKEALAAALRAANGEPEPEEAETEPETETEPGEDAYTALGEEGRTEVVALDSRETARGFLIASGIAIDMLDVPYEVKAVLQWVVNGA